MNSERFWENDYAVEWYNYGIESGNDKIIKFMMHWIAFNWLYREHVKEYEYQCIIAYCKEHFDELSTYDPFSTPEIQVFLEEPVRDMKFKNDREDRWESLKHGTRKQKLISLFLSMYQVRCNLFHGDKSLRIERDVRLIESSSVILENYLKTVLGARIKRMRALQHNEL